MEDEMLKGYFIEAGAIPRFFVDSLKTLLPCSHVFDLASGYIGAACPFGPVYLLPLIVNPML
jgi:hypothetical protein